MILFQERHLSISLQKCWNSQAQWLLVRQRQKDHNWRPAQVRPFQKNKLGIVAHTRNSSFLKGADRRIVVYGQPSQKHETLSEKWLKQKRVGDVAQVVEPLHSKCENLSSNPNTKKKTEAILLENIKLPILPLNHVLWLFHFLSIPNVNFIVHLF
jgi:hypothetical protein